MLLLSVSMSFAPEDFADVSAYVAKLQELSRSEPGCLEYTWSVPVGSENTLHLLECWESQQALDEHLSLPHELEWFASYQPKVIAKEIFTYDPTTRGRL